MYGLTETWNTPLINSIFWVVDREDIISIPLGLDTIVDQLVWHYYAHREYTVKSMLVGVVVTLGNSTLAKWFYGTYIFRIKSKFFFLCHVFRNIIITGW